MKLKIIGIVFLTFAIISITNISLVNGNPQKGQCVGVVKGYYIENGILHVEVLIDSDQNGIFGGGNDITITLRFNQWNQELLNDLDAAKGSGMPYLLEWEWEPNPGQENERQLKRVMPYKPPSNNSKDISTSQYDFYYYPGPHIA